MAKGVYACLDCGRKIDSIELLAIVGGYYGLGKHDEMTKLLRRFRDVTELLRERKERGESYKDLMTLDEAEEVIRKK